MLLEQKNTLPWIDQFDLICLLHLDLVRPRSTWTHIGVLHGIQWSRTEITQQPMLQLGISSLETQGHLGLMWFTTVMWLYLTCIYILIFVSMFFIFVSFVMFIYVQCNYRCGDRLLLSTAQVFCNDCNYCICNCLDVMTSWLPCTTMMFMMMMMMMMMRMARRRISQGWGRQKPMAASRRWGIAAMAGVGRFDSEVVAGLMDSDGCYCSDPCQ